MSSAATPSDAFLSGEGIPVPLGQVENELARLWGPAAEREGGPDLDQPTVTRLVLANLVVCDLLSNGARVRELVEGVSRAYPCRMIVLRPSAEPSGSVRAEVSAVCHLPAPGLPQVCSERIVLQAPRENLALLPGAVRPLLETDLPVILWWAGDPRPSIDLFRDLGDESARLVIDQPDPQPDREALIAGLDLTVNRFSRDLVWFGITPWRELAAGFFDPPGAETALAQLRRVEITAAVPASTPQTPRVAAWMAAWLAGRLGWVPRQRRGPLGAPTNASFLRGDTTIEVSFGCQPGPAVPLPHLLALTLDAGSAGVYRVERGRGTDDVRLAVEAPDRAPLPRTVHVAEWDAARRLAAALESDRDDPPYREALPHLLWLLGAVANR